MRIDVPLPFMVCLGPGGCFVAVLPCLRGWDVNTLVVSQSFRHVVVSHVRGPGDRSMEVCECDILGGGIPGARACTAGLAIVNQPFHQGETCDELATHNIVVEQPAVHNSRLFSR